MTQVISRIVAAVAVAALAGCSFSAPQTKTIQIIPSTQNADVFVDGNLIGTGTQSVDLSTGKAHSVMAKCGESAATGLISRRLSGYGVADIIGGLLILVPFLGLTSDGAYTLTPDTLNVALTDSSGC
jgi:hypothetical protein